MKQGFSLVELSIVLVILGLLTGGILGGQSLMRAAELRSINTDLDRFQVAIHTFRDKYFATPGDMNNAIDFWGAADGGDGTGDDCADAYSSNGSTCNGNNNGRLEMQDGHTGVHAPEWFHAWVHLANAGLIEGSYTGRREADDRGSVPGVNVPRSKISNVGYSIYSFTPSPTDLTDWCFPGDYTLTIVAGAPESWGKTHVAAFTAEEAWAIDTKTDDGKPGTGRIMASAHDDPDCATSGDPDIAEYTLSADSVACSINFILQ